MDLVHLTNSQESSSPKGINHHCVMCGSTNVNIPAQNKDVCRNCDTSFWLFNKLNVVVKFCKGNNILSLIIIIFLLINK